jgi:hypothetical protein
MTSEIERDWKPINLDGILTQEEREEYKRAEQRNYENAMHRLVGPPINSRQGVEFYTGEHYGDR